MNHIKSQDAVKDVAPAAAQSSPCQRLEQLIRSLDLWHDASGNGYVTLRIGSHYEHHAIDSIMFRRWLSAKVFELDRTPLRNRDLQDALLLAEGLAQKGDQHEPARRVASYDGANYIDLCDPEWRAIMVTAEGWEVVPSPPVRFLQSPHARALPKPETGGHINDLRRFVNVSGDDDFILIVAWILAALRPTGPYPILALHGEQGSAKSTTARVIQALVDPSDVPLRSLPGTDRDLVAAAKNNHLLTFDNVSNLSRAIADCLCRLATGGGLGGRQLYTDADEYIFEAKRPVIMTSIPALTSHSDLSERMFSVELTRIEGGKRRTEEALREEFEEVSGRIIGAILDALSCALRRQAEVKEMVKQGKLNLPRMADAAIWVTAAELALGWKHGTFIRTYEAAQRCADFEALELDPVAKGVVELMTARACWEGTMNELSFELQRHSPLPEFIRSSHMTPVALSSHLKRIEPLLRKEGIIIQRLPRTARQRLLRITRDDDSCDSSV